MDVTIARIGATILGRTVGRANLARAHVGSSLVRSALRAMLVCLHYLHRQEGAKSITMTRGLGLPGASSHRLHPRRLTGPILSPYLQAVRA